MAAPPASPAAPEPAFGLVFDSAGPHQAASLKSAPPAPAPALWNPNAAACWSILFTPAFGAYLQMRNWQAMGEPAKAKVSRHWLIASLCLFGFDLGLNMFSSESASGHGLWIVILLAWYIAHGRDQAAEVSKRYGETYPRKGWAGPLWAALGYLVLTMIVGVILMVGVGIAAGSLSN